MPCDVAIIAAVAENGVIGRGNDMPWHLSSDLKRFKALTMGNTLVMGRRTYRSIGRPLPGRRTIVLTSRPIEGVEACPSLGEALNMAQTPVFLAGGADVYREGLGLAETLHITRVHGEPEGDTFFPSLDGEPFRLVQSEPAFRADGDEFATSYETWARI